MQLRNTLIAFATMAALAAHPQTPKQIPDPTTLEVYSRETIVDITVTDAKGNPVHGLKQEDFTVKEDNKPQPIRSFEEFTSKPAPAPPKLPPNVYTNLQPPAASAAINVLWLDFTNLAPVLAVSCCGVAGPKNLASNLAVQRRVKQYAMQYLHAMPTGTRVAVLGTSEPGSLRLLQGVTSDPELLSAAIDSLEFDTNGMAMGDKESWCAQQEKRNRMTLEAVNQMATDMAAIKGRKNLIWFTHGLPTITSPPPSCLTDQTRELNKAYGLLAAAQVTVYPVGASGVPGPDDPPDDWLSMEAVAEGTGGAAYYNNNDLATQVSKAIATGSDYYTLTYVPPGTEYDGRHHTINLKLNLDPPQPGLHLTYRDSYYAEDPRKMSPAPGLTLASVPSDSPKADMKAAMSRNLPPSTQLLFDVQVEPSTVPPKPDDPPVMGTLDPKVKKDHLIRYGFQYAIPARQIAFTEGPNNTHKGAMELDIAAYDTDGHLVTGLSQTVNMPLSDTRYKEFIKGPFRFFQQLDLPPGQLFLRVGILDPTSNKVGTLEIPLTVPKK